MIDESTSLGATGNYDRSERAEAGVPLKSQADSMRLGRHHFAHLRFVAEGIAVADSAQRFLGIEHAASAVTAHRLVLERLRALTRRRGDARWRLIGLSIPRSVGHGGAAGAGNAPPTLAEWAEAQGIEDWSEAELQEMYREAFPTDRKSSRNQRLRERQRELLFELERLAAETPQPSDLIAGWFEEAMARQMQTAGWLTLGDLQRTIARGGRWWRAVPGVGVIKAARLAAYLDTLLPAQALRPRATRFRVGSETACAVGFDTSPHDAEGVQESAPAVTSGSDAVVARLPQSSIGSNRAAAMPSGTTARDDPEAIDAWIAAKAGSPATARAYRKEAERLLAWCLLEKNKPLSSMALDDCLAYLAFLEHLPEDWVSLRYAKRHEPGWTPFRGPLSAGSCRYALGVLSALFDWLVSAGYLQANPWRLVNRRIADDRFAELDSRAFTPQAWAALHAFLESNRIVGNSPARERIEFLLAFGEATGLRASELVGARLSHFKKVNRGWVLQVQGKGGKGRVVAVPRQAVEALNDYLHRRGIGTLDSLDTPRADCPLVASALDPNEPVSYSALYRSVKSWLQRAIWASDLSIQEKLDAKKASLHWLRHTCGTRALERSVPLEVVQRQLGHADPRTTMRYAKPQLERLQAEMERGFG